MINRIKVSLKIAETKKGLPMSSINAERSIGNSWRWSISRRLILSYTLSACVMLAITFAFLNWTIRDTLITAENDYINDRIRVFRAIIESRSDYIDVIRHDIEWEGAYVTFPEYYARIQDTHCSTLVETPGMFDLIPPHQFPAACELGKEIQNQSVPEKSIYYRGKNGRLYLLKSYWTDTVNPSQRLSIQMAIDINSEKGIVQTNQQRMLTISILGILFSVLFSFVVARKVLLPLSELAGLAKRITIDKISLRTNDPLRWPVELRAPAIAFNDMLDRLKNSFTHISQYTSNLAHELRTPINNLMGEAEVALSQERTPEEYRKILESGLEEHMRLARMIDALLFLARAEHPANQIESSLFDPMEEITKVCSFYEALAEEKQAHITWNGDGLLYGDPILFRRVMNNLVSNALYYSSSGVRIDISVKKSGDNFLVVVVSDTGHGIPQEDLNNIFDRFYRVMNSRSNNPQGSGLGLSIVKFIMELHNGTVTIQSVPSQGTTVTLRFPGPPPEPLKI
jgi:two-component system, OmpR family, heavy metal sensor histidine kinase CusS